MMLIKPQEKLLVTVFVYRPQPQAVPETWEARVVHCANRIGDDECAETAEYETTQVYMASGVMNDDAERFLRQNTRDWRSTPVNT
jgi:hypothetical protein